MSKYSQCHAQHHPLVHVNEVKVQINKKCSCKSTHIVVGVEHSGDVLSEVSIEHSLNVASNINCGTTARRAVHVCWFYFSQSDVSRGQYSQSFRLKSQGAFADHSLIVLTMLFL